MGNRPATDKVVLTVVLTLVSAILGVAVSIPAAFGLLYGIVRTLVWMRGDPNYYMLMWLSIPAMCLGALFGLILGPFFLFAVVAYVRDRRQKRRGFRVQASDTSTSV